MNGDVSTTWRRVFGLVGLLCKRAALWVVVVCAWCIRKTLTPLAKGAGAVEAWALDRLTDD